VENARAKVVDEDDDEAATNVVSRATAVEYLERMVR